MAHKKKHSAPVPPANKSHNGPAHDGNEPAQKGAQSPAEVTSAQEHDPKRRLGDFSGTAEHPLQQPGGHNDTNH